MEEGKELDALVAEKVMGWPALEEFESIKLWNRDVQFRKHIVWTDQYGPGYWRLWSDRNLDAQPWAPSTDMSDAWEVIKRMVDLGFRTIKILVDDEDGIARVVFSNGNRYYGEAETLPVAVCQAALNAVELSEGGEKGNLVSETLKSLWRWNNNRSKPQSG